MEQLMEWEFEGNPALSEKGPPVTLFPPLDPTWDLSMTHAHRVGKICVLEVLDDVSALPV
jgi:hypothetical protein